MVELGDLFFSGGSLKNTSYHATCLLAMDWEGKPIKQPRSFATALVWKNSGRYSHSY